MIGCKNLNDPNILSWLHYISLSMVVVIDKENYVASQNHVPAKTTL